MDRDDIIIKKAIVHILDSYMGMPVLSDRELECGPDLYEFFRAHLEKVTNSDDIKQCRFMEDSMFPMVLEGFCTGKLCRCQQGIGRRTLSDYECEY